MLKDTLEVKSIDEGLSSYSFTDISSLNLNECQDKVPNCPEFDDGELCIEPSYHSWAYEHCKAYCKFGSCNRKCIFISKTNTIMKTIFKNTDVCIAQGGLTFILNEYFRLDIPRVAFRRYSYRINPPYIQQPIRSQL